MGVVDYLTQITELTNTNLKILESINKAFYTNDNYVGVSTDEGSFNIPSFISLENKINALQSNFENLVNAPVTSEAHFTFDGDSRAIELKRYEQSPASLVLGVTKSFEHENNDILKDFLTPVPYINFKLGKDIPNDITSVVVRKVSALSETAKERFAGLLEGDTSKTTSWGDIAKVLDDLNEDTDYTLYDTTRSLPIRKGQGNGQYVISSVSDDIIDENLDQHIIIGISPDAEGYQTGLTYTAFDQTIEKDLKPGDYLVSWDGCAKFLIEECNFSSNTIKVRVMYGSYINLTAWSGEGSIDDTSKLRYFSGSDLFSEENYVNVPLEEDQYVYIAIAPLNNRMNVRAAWGEGLLVNTYELTTDGGDVKFEDYYKNCRNIGDVLNEISKVMGNTITSYSDDELNKFTAAKPVVDPDIIKVTHINKHLDETTTIKNIRALYSQKNSYNADLTNTQTSLTQLQDQLSAVDFEDTTGLRQKLQSQIDVLTKKKNELISSLMKISNEIALAANNSVVPIEDAKYRIRGFFDFVSFAESLGIDETSVKGIKVQYRYRNVQLETGTAETFVKDVNGNGEVDAGDKTFVFSDWNIFPTPLRPRIRTSDGQYEAEPDNSNKNEPSFNQIDIPISQGENVDVRLMVIYDFGYPFIQMTSAWSDVVTFEFPDEFLKDVSVVDIIEENNNDIETNRFKTILIDDGITAHVDDSILDQDVTYFHKPENISSGFYTSERRIIPLRDKLKEINDAIIRISDEIDGTTAENLAVTIEWDESSIALSPFEQGNILLKQYSDLKDYRGQKVGNYAVAANGVASILCNIKLTNASTHSLKIFSIFPATDKISINQIINTRFTVNDYKDIFVSDIDDNNSRVLHKQTSNQIITFRNNNPYDGKEYYDSGEKYGDVDKLSTTEAYVKFPDQTISYGGMAVYPYCYKKNGLLMTYNEAYKYLLMNPGDELIFPVMVEYRLDDDAFDFIYKTIAFDIRTSLYSDPLNYSLRIGAKYINTPEDKLANSLAQRFIPAVLRTKEYKTIIN